VKYNFLTFHQKNLDFYFYTLGNRSIFTYICIFGKENTIEFNPIKKEKT